MDVHSRHERDMRVEYCLFEGRLARLWLDSETGEYTEADALDDDRTWVACPVFDTLSESEAITDEEAVEYAIALGVTI